MLADAVFIATEGYYIVNIEMCGIEIYWKYKMGTRILLVRLWLQNVVGYELLLCDMVNEES